MANFFFPELHIRLIQKSAVLDRTCHSPLLQRYLAGDKIKIEHLTWAWIISVVITNTVGPELFQACFEMEMLILSQRLSAADRQWRMTEDCNSNVDQNYLLPLTAKRFWLVINLPVSIWEFWKLHFTICGSKIRKSYLIHRMKCV